MLRHFSDSPISIFNYSAVNNLVGDIRGISLPFLEYILSINYFITSIPIFFISVRFLYLKMDRLFYPLMSNYILLLIVELIINTAHHRYFLTMLPAIILGSFGPIMKLASSAVRILKKRLN